MSEKVLSYTFHRERVFDRVFFDNTTAMNLYHLSYHLSNTTVRAHSSVPQMPELSGFFEGSYTSLYEHNPLALKYCACMGMSTLSAAARALIVSMPRLGAQSISM